MTDTIIELDTAKAKAARKPQRLRMVRACDIAPRLQTAYLVKGLLGREGIAEIFGDSNCGKTFFALDLAEHISAGTDWRGRKTRQSAVVYVAAESGASIDNRIEAIRTHRGIPEDSALFVIPCAADLRTLGGDADELVARVIEASQQCDMPAGLVVLDTLMAVMPGGSDNEPKDMGALLMNVAKIRDETKALVLIVHHSGKDPSRGARGHSSLRAAVDTEIEVSRDEAGLSLATVTKQRDLPGGEKFPFTLERVEIGTDEDGDTVSSCVVAEVDAPTQPERKSVSLPPSAKVALNLLRKALDEEGSPAPSSNHIPVGARVVDYELWRKYCYAGQISDSDDPAAKRQAFKRSADILISRNVARRWEQLVWLCE